jgi:hypothetical protein
VNKSKPKPVDSSKQAVWKAWLRVKANRGAAGVDEQSISEFEWDLFQTLEQGLVGKLLSAPSVASAFKATLLGFGFLKRKGEIKIRIDPQARERAKDLLREITSRRWGVSMRRRSVKPTALRWDGRPTSRWPTSRVRSLTSMSGCAAGCGRLGGRNGSATEPGGAICKRSVSQPSRPTNGLLLGRGTGDLHVPLISSVPCRTRTGATLAYADLLALTAVSGMRRKPPDADPHVRWYERGGGKPHTLPDSELPTLQSWERC